MYQYLTLNIRYCFLFQSNVCIYLCNIKYIIHPPIKAIKVGFTFLNLRMAVYSAALVSWMDKELTDLWIPVPPFPLPAPLLMVSLPLPLPRPPWMESKRVSKAVKSYVFFPAVADESSFSVLLFFLLSCSCCSAVWMSLEETSVKAHLSRQPFSGGETSISVSTTRAWRVDLRVGSYVLWLCVLAPSPSSGLINNLKLCDPPFSRKYAGRKLIKKHIYQLKHCLWSFSLLKSADLFPLLNTFFFNWKSLNTSQWGRLHGEFLLNAFSLTFWDLVSVISVRSIVRMKLRD